MASYKVCVFIALACAFVACSAEEGKRVERFVYPYGGIGFGAATLPVATSYSLPIAKTIIPSYAATSWAAPVAPLIPRVAAAPLISRVAAAPLISRVAAAPLIPRVAAAPLISTYAAAPALASPLVSSFGYSGLATGYSTGFGYGAYGAPLLKK